MYRRNGAKGKGKRSTTNEWMPNGDWNTKNTPDEHRKPVQLRTAQSQNARQYWQTDYRQSQGFNAMAMQPAAYTDSDLQAYYYSMDPWMMQQAASQAHTWMTPSWDYTGVKQSTPQDRRSYSQGQRETGKDLMFTDQRQTERSNSKKSRRSRRKKRVDSDLEERHVLPSGCSEMLRKFRDGLSGGMQSPLELKHIREHIVEFATDHFGSRLIIDQLEKAPFEDKTLVEAAVLQDFRRLTEDEHGNYVVQKLFECGSATHRRNLANKLAGTVWRLSLHTHGCRVIQKALESVSVEQQINLVSELHGHVIECVEDQNGNHVIQKCIERMPPEKIQFIVDAFKGNVQRMACHCYGCRILQRLMEHSTPSLQLAPILDEVAHCVPQLSQDQFGNYVVQHMLEHGRSDDRRLILEIVCSQILMLSTHKFASNVVEKAIISASGSAEERAPLLHAIVGIPSDVHPPLFTMMRDRYGNYIVQRVLELAQDEQRSMLLWRLKDQSHVLQKFTYGKHIMQALEDRESRQ